MSNLKLKNRKYLHCVSVSSINGRKISVWLSNDAGTWLPTSVNIDFNVQLLRHQLLVFKLGFLQQKRLSSLVWSSSYNHRMV